MRRIVGHYRIASNSSNRDTSAEIIKIIHIGERRFSINSTSGPVGDWNGTFVVSESNSEHGLGVYRYLSDIGWGKHEFQIDPQAGKIYVYGTNMDRVGTIGPFSYTLEKVYGNNR